jgi:hypothetical protein
MDRDGQAQGRAAWSGGTMIDAVTALEWLERLIN